MTRVGSARALIATFALSLALPAAAHAAAGTSAGTLAGAFRVSGVLPESASLRVVLTRKGEDAPLATQDVAQNDDSVAFSFPALAPGIYRVRLLALRDERELALATTPETELTPGMPSRESVLAPAPAKEGSLSGTLKMSGSAPAGKLVFVNARRVDITHKSYMPDGVNNASFEISDEELRAGRARYTFAGLSCGVFKVRLMSYDYDTHATVAHGELAGELLIDLDHKLHENLDFTGSFAPKR